VSKVIFTIVMIGGALILIAWALKAAIGYDP
jgi:hypothetical protein